VAEKQRPGRREPRKPNKSTNDDVSGFDSWLENKLRTAYSSVLDEPIPEDLIQLISQKLRD
jgi:hypothetical protein